MTTSELMIVHERYNPNELWNDIALIKTRDAAPLNGEIKNQALFIFELEICSKTFQRLHKHDQSGSG